MYEFCGVLRGLFADIGLLFEVNVTEWVVFEGGGIAQQVLREDINLLFYLESQDTVPKPQIPPVATC